ncbi:MAG: helix-turn-helix domain-containing protein, partial [Defluviitaleaceae bacterium]|nr:helix-turn-helix domain-containing protein [Defluviitaleaceae bacterium]
MTIYEKLRRIRNKLGFAESTVALTLGCSASEFADFENGKVDIPDELIPKWKSALGISEVPITDIEVKTFEEALWSWRTIINSWLVELAGEGVETLKRRAELSCEPHLLHIYTL